MEKEIQNLLLSWDEYNQKEFSVPYIYSIKNDKQELSYFGLLHTFDPKAQVINSIEKLWDEFIQKYSSNSITAVIEGDFTKNQYERDEMIQKGGESGFLIYLARRSDVEIKCFETKRGDTLNKLLEKYSKENLFYHTVVEYIYQWNTIKEKPDFDLYTNRYTEREGQETGWVDFDFSMENFRKIHKNLFGVDFNKEDKMVFYNAIDPSQKNGIINDISRDIDIYRDTAIVKGIIEEWRKGKSVFVVYGSGHAVIQERALRELLK